MIVTTAETIAGRTIGGTLGIARGNTIRARHVGTDIVAGLRNIVGGEVPEYTKLLAEAREQAYDRMVVSAQAMGADAIIAMRFSISAISQGVAEILAYGTAVKLD
ncbi:YbjQ family protein [Pelagibacterium sp. H642]|uniref:YbjQ family protein n=1 Tax=Pelagibacterium sp. H642 TaxID=1881069 RepID=UPI00281633DF|nr:YbjQ family protein [Pelagibacterium sp. H642]WMT90590.1 YbjQ family protein [Pelagibacterium sp. H642]